MPIQKISTRSACAVRAGWPGPQLFATGKFSTCPRTIAFKLITQSLLRKKKKWTNRWFHHDMTTGLIRCQRMSSMFFFLFEFELSSVPWFYLHRQTTCRSTGKPSRYKNKISQKEDIMFCKSKRI